MNKTTEIRSVGDILTDLLGPTLAKASPQPLARETEPKRHSTKKVDSPVNKITEGHYDLDLAEFPLFHFHTTRVGKADPTPLRYQDTIKGANGQPVVREWIVHPGPLGFGGPSSQALLYDLLQLYIEQGAQSSQIQFGTLRSLFLRRGQRNPSARDYDRIRRDLDILRGYDIHCRNAFWDWQRRAYVSMKWRLFGSVFYFREGSAETSIELPFGFIEVSPVLRQVARTRGFFTLGFGHKVFHELKPLEQRLALYLAKKFTSQKIHCRFVEDLSRALPLESARPRDNLANLKRAAQGLLDKKLPILASFSLKPAKDRRMVAVFHRGQVPTQLFRIPPSTASSLAPSVAELVNRIILVTGNSADRFWWTQCATRLGSGSVDRALGQLKEAIHLQKVRSPGALLTKIFKDIAKDTGVALL